MIIRSKSWWGLLRKAVVGQQPLQMVSAQSLPKLEQHNLPPLSIDVRLCIDHVLEDIQSKGFVSD
jgi:hypothetical protein